MLGVCNTCVRLQSRVTISGAKIDGLFFYGEWGKTNNWVFHWGREMGMEALIGKNTGVLGGVEHYNLCLKE